MIAYIQFCRDDGVEVFSATATSFENIRARLDGWEKWVADHTEQAQPPAPQGVASDVPGDGEFALCAKCDGAIGRKSPDEPWQHLRWAGLHKAEPQ